jgi:hypothetical protein
MYTDGYKLQTEFPFAIWKICILLTGFDTDPPNSKALEISGSLLPRGMGKETQLINPECSRGDVES